MNMLAQDPRTAMMMPGATSSAIGLQGQLAAKAQEMIENPPAGGDPKAYQRDVKQAQRNVSKIGKLIPKLSVAEGSLEKSNPITQMILRKMQRRNAKLMAKYEGVQAAKMSRAATTPGKEGTRSDKPKTVQQVRPKTALRSSLAEVGKAGANLSKAASTARREVAQRLILKPQKLAPAMVAARHAGR